MRFIDATEMDAVLTEDALTDALAEMFRAGCEQPLRHHHIVDVPDEPEATLLLMPAWQPGEAVGVKIVGVFPGNSARGAPAITGQYLLLDGRTGAPTALMDGARMTVWRTAAASGLAARYLARKDASRMVMVGAGALAPFLIRAHRAARPGLDDIAIWARRPEQAQALADQLSADGLPARAVTDLEGEVRQADVISCATISKDPLVSGDWLKPGAHLDLVGAFRPDMRESDDAAIRAADVFVDTRQGATNEGGDIVMPLKDGVLSLDDIHADLFDLCQGTHEGRASDQSITLFKSVGAALEDLAAARLIAALV